MPKSNNALLAFNRGVVSKLALARVDLDRMRLSAETQTNWMPRVLGSMMLRPGWEYIYATKSNNKTRNIEFIAATDDTAIIEFTDSVIRISVDETVITRPSVTASVTNGLFTSDVTSWTDADESGAVSSWLTGGYLNLLGSGTNEAARTQEVTVAETGTVHALRIVIHRGPVRVKIGSTATNGSYHTATLGTGTHSLAFTPTGNFFINFASSLSYSVIVDSVAVEASGDLELPSPYVEADLPLIRYTQSADVVFLCGGDSQQRKLERRNNDSWSIVLYEPLTGPFGTINTGPTTITPSALSGDVTLTASKNLFTGSASEHSGHLFRLVSSGQTVQASVTAEDNFTNSVKITGVGSSRAFSVSIAGTWAATCTLQRSTDDATWEDVQTYTANTSTNFDDGLDNVEYFYRIGVKTGDFTSGTIELGLSFSGGSLTGIAKVRSVVSATVANATVIDAFGGTDATDDWYSSQWSDSAGWPTAIALYSRMFFAGKGKVWGSISDEFEDFDDSVEGDSGPINRFIGQGPVDNIHWLAPLLRLILGTAGAEISARSTSFDEPLTPTNFNLKNASTEGAADIDIIIDGTRAMFVQRAGSKLYQLQYSLESNDYISADLSELAPEITQPSIVCLAIQRQPDIRIHCVRSDGKVAVLVKDDPENTLAWILVETDGEVEDALVLPGSVEDKVYYTVKRTINGSTVRYLEKWALESEGRGGTTSKIGDSFLYYSGTATTTITGLSHLEGESVVVWGNGKDLGTKTVTSGQITGLSEAVTTACVGLSYSATFKSTKLAYAAGMGTALNQVKKINQLGLVATDLHAQGIQVGPSEDELYDLPLDIDHQIVSEDDIHLDFDQPSFPFGGHWDSDSRLVMKATAPRPATILAAVVGIQTNDKS